MSKNNKPSKKQIPVSQTPVNQTINAKNIDLKTTQSYGKWLAIGVLIITLFVAFSGGFDNKFVDRKSVV